MFAPPGQKRRPPPRDVGAVRRRSQVQRRRRRHAANLRQGVEEHPHPAGRPRRTRCASSGTSASWAPSTAPSSCPSPSAFASPDLAPEPDSLARPALCSLLRATLSRCAADPPTISRAATCTPSRTPLTHPPSHAHLAPGTLTTNTHSSLGAFADDLNLRDEAAEPERLQVELDDGEEVLVVVAVPVAVEVGGVLVSLLVGELVPAKLVGYPVRTRGQRDNLGSAWC